MRVTLDTCCCNLKPNEYLDEIFRQSNLGTLELAFTDAFEKDVMKGELDINVFDEKKQTAIRERLQKAQLHKQCAGAMVLSDPHYGRLDQNTLPGPGWIPEAELENIIGQNAQDIRHVQVHIFFKRDVFVTSNTKDFVNGGKRNALAALGIVVKTPDEFVNWFQARVARISVA